MVRGTDRLGTRYRVAARQGIAVADLDGDELKRELEAGLER